jgi:tetratricopeptide (TPR) repeat protein
MPPRKTSTRSKQRATQPPSPAEQQKLNALLEKLHEGINNGAAPQALPKLLEMRDHFPNDVNVHVLLGRTYLALRKVPESLASYRKAASMQPDQPELNFQYGIALENAGDLEHAIDRFHRTLKRAPKHFYAMAHISSALMSLERKDEAYEAYLDLVAAFKDDDLDPLQRNSLAITASHFAPDRISAEQAIEGLESNLADADDRDVLRSAYAQLGRLHRHLKHHEESLDSFEKCKGVDKDVWIPDAHSAHIDRLIACWADGCDIPQSKLKNIDGSRLIFIVGMPRSGTTLTEQMLAQVETISPGGEMNAVDSKIPKGEPVPFKYGTRLPITKSLYTQQTIDSMAKSAFKDFNKVDRKKTITDKQPYNYALVPMIARLFPGARFIHTKRDPLDCCFSNYTTAFTQLHMQTHDQYWLGRYFADYERIMHAWAQLPEVNMIDLHYEDLVADPEGQMRRVLDFVGHDWTDRILQFHTSDRTVKTASRNQVTKPLYTSSVKKYAPYEHRLGELKRGIEEGRAIASRA